MNQPQAVGVSVARLVAGMPPEAKQWVLDNPPGDLTAAYAELDRVALAEQAAERRRIRNARYVQHRPVEYESAGYGMLRAQQDPERRVSGWLSSGVKNLLLMGPSWTGKSFDAWAIGNDASGRGVWVEAWFVPELAALVGPQPPHLWNDAQHAAAVEAARDRATWCDLLILDDLGREETREGLLERWRAALLMILNDRAGDPRRRTIVTGNAADRDGIQKKLEARYGAPVMNRLLNDCTALWIQGEPFRTANPFTAT